MANPLLGVFFHWLGGLSSASFYAPYRGVRGWSWEIFWLFGGLFSWVIGPWFFASVQTKDLIGVLSAAPPSTLFWCYVFGALWGLMKISISKIATIAAALLLGACATMNPQRPSEDAYIFSSFRGNGGDGLHLAYSYDGLTWTALNEDRSFLTPQVGGKLMRDPCIVKGPDGLYHMVWTTGWWENNIAIAHSPDLVNWSEQTMLPVMAHAPNVLNSWAPEIFHDEETGEYIIFWSSAVPGSFPETEDRGDIRSTLGIGINHRIHYVKTRDFRTYTPTALFYDGGFVSIDATILREGRRYIMFIKDETKRPEPEKNIRIAIAASAQGPYGPASTPISPPGVWVEGPTAVKIGDMFYLYYDAYMEHRMMAARSRDLIHWEDISVQTTFPEGTRHGSVLRVEREVVDGLRQATAPQ